THNGLELREAILTGIEQANQLIINNTCGAATTIAITEINGRLVRTYHAGDSEILITGQRGKIKYQTLAHSPVGYAVESGLLNNEQAIMHAERHIVSNVLGYRDMHVSVGTQVRLDPRDTLLVATDGLFDNLHKTEIVDYIRKGKLINCCNALIDNTYQRMMEDDPEHPSKHDDLTFILFRLSRD
ncbi:MAG: PP2C family protein-serine/threonine phosphatase, partial [bacterium]